MRTITLIRNGSGNNLQPQSSEQAPNDPAWEAAQQTASAKANEKAIQTKAKLLADTTNAKAISDDARSRSKDAFDSDPSTKSGRDSHATAAMAHKDASQAYNKLASAASGHDLETRGKCQGMADKHQQMADRHGKIAEGMAGLSGKSVLNSGRHGG